MGLILKNALLCDIDPIEVEAGDLRVDGDRIVARGEVARQAGDEVIDCGGAVLMPGMVNGHTHLYSALAVGMPAPPRNPRNFLEILQLVWWRLDRALDAESIELSARIGAIEALRCGTTTLIDHHASPTHIEHSLDWIEHGIAAAGLRGVLCYETTDRNGHHGREEGLEENRRYLEKCAQRKDGRFAALVGAHASFTLKGESLDSLAKLAEKFGAGVHIHVAEDACDEKACRDEHKAGLIERLVKHGILRRDSILAHGIHLDRTSIARVNDIGLSWAHNPRSNMNNAVGYAPIPEIRCPILLGTDGIGGDMFTEAKHAWFKACDAHAGIGPQRVIEMLAASARRASHSLGVTLGKLEVGAAADVVVTDYVPFTPLTTENFPGHFIFAMGSQNVRHVIASGKWALRDRNVVSCNADEARQQSIGATQRMWERLARIEPSP